MVSDVAELSNVAKRHAHDRRSMFQGLSSVGRMVVDRLESNYDIEDDDEDTQMNANEYPSIKKKSVVTNSEVMKSSINGSNTFMTSIYENLDEWEEPELQDAYQAVSKENLFLTGLLIFFHFSQTIDSSNFRFRPLMSFTFDEQSISSTPIIRFHLHLEKRRQGKNVLNHLNILLVNFWLDAERCLILKISVKLPRVLMGPMIKRRC